MSALAVLDAERLKLTTTRSPLWSAVAAAVLSFGVAAVQGLTAHDFNPLEPEEAALGVAVFGVPVLMILASMTVTGEYRSGMIHATFMATPRRGAVLLAKMVVSAVFSGAYAALMVVGSALIARLAASPMVGQQLSLTATPTWRTAGAMAVYAMLAAVLGVGVGAVLRYAAAVVAVLLLWPLVVEPLLGNLPNAGTELGPYLPFGNVLRFVEVSWLYPSYSYPWGQIGSLVYFAVVVAVVFAAAVVVTNRRDA